MTVKEQIQRHEGCRLMAYRDTLGFLTIGYGRCLDKRGISREEADFMLDNDLRRIEAELSDVRGLEHLDPVRRGVLIEMMYQLGSVQGFPKFLTAVRQGEWATAAKEMLDSRWHSQTPERCEELAKQMETGTA